MKKITLFTFLIVLVAVAWGLALEPVKGFITNYGHATFLLEAGDGYDVKIVIDPHADKLGYPLPDQPIDIVTISHEHADHNNLAGIKGNPVVLRGLKPDGSWNKIDQEIKGVHIYNVGVYHDTEKGAKRGRNNIFVFEFSGIKVVHCGDLGHLLDKEAIKAIGKPDFLLLPVGGYYTIDASQAQEVVKQLNPTVVIPMHYQTETTKSLPIKPIDGFLEGLKNVLKIKHNEVSLDVPAEQSVWVLPIVK